MFRPTSLFSLANKLFPKQSDTQATSNQGKRPPDSTSAAWAPPPPSARRTNAKDKPSVFAPLGLTFLRAYHRAGSSLASGTLVHTPSGPKAIENLKPGDFVLSTEFNNDAPRGLVVSKPVTAIFSSQQRLYEIVLNTQRGPETIKAAAGHLFFTNQGWVRADHLNRRHVLHTVDSDTQAAVQSTKKTHEIATVCDMTVADYHVYYAGDLGALVHNTENDSDKESEDNEKKVDPFLSGVFDFFAALAFEKWALLALGPVVGGGLVFGSNAYQILTAFRNPLSAVDNVAQLSDDAARLVSQVSKKGALLKDATGKRVLGKALKDGEFVDDAGKLVAKLDDAGRLVDNEGRLMLVLEDGRYVGSASADGFLTGPDGTQFGRFQDGKLVDDLGHSRRLVPKKGGKIEIETDVQDPEQQWRALFGRSSADNLSEIQKATLRDLLGPEMKLVTNKTTGALEVHASAELSEDLKKQLGRLETDWNIEVKTVQPIPLPEIDVQQLATEVFNVGDKSFGVRAVLYKNGDLLIAPTNGGKHFTDNQLAKIEEFRQTYAGRLNVKKAAHQTLHNRAQKYSDSIVSDNSARKTGNSRETLNAANPITRTDIDGQKLAEDLASADPDGTGGIRLLRIDNNTFKVSTFWKTSKDGYQPQDRLSSAQEAVIQQYQQQFPGIQISFLNHKNMVDRTKTINQVVGDDSRFWRVEGPKNPLRLAREAREAEQVNTGNAARSRSQQKAGKGAPVGDRLPIASLDMSFLHNRNLRENPLTPEEGQKIIAYFHHSGHYGNTYRRTSAMSQPRFGDEYLIASSSDEPPTLEQLDLINELRNNGLNVNIVTGKVRNEQNFPFHNNSHHAEQKLLTQGSLNIKSIYVTNAVCEECAADLYLLNGFGSRDLAKNPPRIETEAQTQILRGGVEVHKVDSHLVVGGMRVERVPNSEGTGVDLVVQVPKKFIRQTKHQHIPPSREFFDFLRDKKMSIQQQDLLGSDGRWMSETQFLEQRGLGDEYRKFVEQRRYVPPGAEDMTRDPVAPESRPKTMSAAELKKDMAEQSIERSGANVDVTSVTTDPNNPATIEVRVQKEKKDGLENLWGVPKKFTPTDVDTLQSAVEELKKGNVNVRVVAEDGNSFPIPSRPPKPQTPPPPESNNE